MNRLFGEKSEDSNLIVCKGYKCWNVIGILYSTSIDTHSIANTVSLPLMWDGYARPLTCLVRALGRLNFHKTAFAFVYFMQVCLADFLPVLVLDTAHDRHGEREMTVIGSPSIFVYLFTHLTRYVKMSTWRKQMYFYPVAMFRWALRYQSHRWSLGLELFISNPYLYLSNLI